MIYSVTLNPSIDFIVRVKDFQIGETNRAYEDNFFAGGKGIMVSKLLKNVGTECVNLGFLGGFTGAFIEKNLKKLNKRLVFFIFLLYNKANNSFLISKKNVKISKK